MADYYPLIARAIVGSDKNTAESRRAIYERARGALLAQLRSVNPPLSEQDITRERLALEEAVRRVEAEAVRQARVESSRPPPAARESAPRSREPDPAKPASRPSDQGASRGVERGPSLLEEALKDFHSGAGPSSNYRDPNPAKPARLPPAPSLPPSARPSDLRPADLARAEPRPPEPRPPGSRPQEPRLSDPRPQENRGQENRGQESRAQESRAQDFRSPEPRDLDQRAEPRAGESWTGRASAGRGAEARAPESRQDFRQQPRAEPRFAAAPARAEAQDFDVPPTAGHGPLPEDEDESEPPKLRRSYRGLGVALLLLIVIGGLGALAYWQLPNLISLVQQNRAPFTPATPPQRDATQARPKIDDRLTPGQDQSRANGAQTAAVAQRVVLYEEDPSDPQGKRYVGSAIWRTETTSPGPGQAPELVVRADVEVPERKMAMTFTLRRNTDPALPASHTIEVIFKLPPDFNHSGVGNVPGILMKPSEQDRGTPLAGASVKVTAGYFLIALHSMDTERDRNIKLLKERPWFDVPIVYADNRRAILAMEKGTPGDRAFTDAFAAWGQ